VKRPAPRRPTPIDLGRVRDWFNHGTVYYQDHRRAEDRIRDELRDSRAIIIKGRRWKKALP
jgi:hypothetical protein